MVYKPIKEGSITHRYKEMLEDLQELALQAKKHNNFSSAVGYKSFDTDICVVNRARLVGVYRKNDKVVVASADIQSPHNYNSYIINHIHYYELPIEKEIVVEHFNLVINEYLV